MLSNVPRPVCLRVALAACLTAFPAAQAPAQSNPARVGFTRGSVSFEVATNMFGTTVRGTSSALTGATILHDVPPALRLERLEASLPVESLKTGIRLRDRHMIEYVFRTPDGQRPDIRFTAETAECARPSAAAAYRCAVSGLLVIRETARPFTIALDVSPDGAVYRVKGSARIALSDYGIERPSQLGVRTEDEVGIRVEFSARPAPAGAGHAP